jgi:hypothetical protein
MKIFRFIPHIISAASFFLIIYVAYKFFIFHEGEYFYYYKKYFIITSIIFLMSLLLFFTSEILRKIFFLSLVSSIIALYLVETVMVLQLKNSLSKKLNDMSDKRSKIEVILSLKKKGIEANPSMYANYSSKENIYSFGGISKTLTILCNENGYWASYLSDRYGFRNQDNFWDSKNITLIMGDSTGQGSCVNNENYFSKNFSYSLKENRNFQKTNILNLSIGARGPLSIYANLREYIDIIKPKKIIWLYHESNDLYDLESEMKGDFLKQYLDNENFSQKLNLQQNKIDKILLEKNKKDFLNKIKNPNTKLNGWYDYKYFIRLSMLRLAILHPDQINYSDSTLKDFEHVMNKAKELSKKYGSDLYFVYIPDYARFIGNNNSPYYKDYQKIINIIQNLEIKIIDINKELFQDEIDPLKYFPFRKRGHYNEAGYNELAKHIYKNIKW